MTRQEAKKIMENEVRCVRNPNCERLECRNCYLVMPEHTVLKAYDVAIKALEQEPCEDAISRTWLKKAFHNYFQGLVHVVTEEDVQAYIDVAPSVTPKQRWIPVSEGLPDERKSVLVWCPEYRNMYCAYLENKSWWIFGAFSQIIPNAVIAWMPLPLPFELQESEEQA